MPPSKGKLPEMSVAVMKTKAELALAEQFANLRGTLPGAPEVAAVREDAIATFAELGLPHRRIEEWKYTDLRAALKEPPPPAVGETVGVPAAGIAAALGPFGDIAASRIVFVNGQYRPEISIFDGREGVSVSALSQNFLKLVAAGDDAVSALNTAFVTDGAEIEIKPGTKLAKPLFVVAVAAGSTPRLSTLRHTMTVGAGVEATIVELYVTLPGADAGGQVNTLTEIHVGKGAQVTHVKAAVDDGRATHLSNWIVRLGAECDYKGFQMTSGLALARNSITATFTGEGAKLDLSGAFLGRGSDHIDTTLVVDHAVPRCESRELFTGVLDGRARGIFQGKVIVRPKAQKTDGKQMAKVMMLSPDAEFDSKPELEIYADDVVCGHGSTAAEIDADLLFYCMARGIPVEQARGLLVESFIGEAIDKVGHEGVREALGKTARDWLAAVAI